MSIKEDFDYLVVNVHFPRIAMGLEIRWGTADFEPYVMDLLNDTRNHTRQGFPKEVYSSLNRILLTHHNLFPSKRRTSKDAWDSTFGDLTL
jgi:hypothetical protein